LQKKIRKEGGGKGNITAKNVVKSDPPKKKGIK